MKANSTTAIELYLRPESFGGVIWNATSGDYHQVDHAQALRLCDDAAAETSSPLLRSMGVPIGASVHISRIASPRPFEGGLSAPFKAFVNVTRRCNLHCVHCYNDSGHASSPELPIDDLTRLIGEFERRGVFMITVSGGEPLVHKDFDRLLDALGESALHATVVTNGVGLTEERARSLEAVGAIKGVTVSFDGGNPGSHDRVRGGGSFDRAMNGLLHLRRHFTRSLSARVTLMRTNVASMPELVERLAAAGITRLKMNRFNPYGRGEAHPELKQSADEYIATARELGELARHAGIRAEVPSEKYLIDAAGVLGLCRAGSESCEVDADGNVYPCSFSSGRFRAGNIVGLEDFDPVFASLRAHSINNPFCMQCRGRGGSMASPTAYVPRLVQIHISRRAELLGDPPGGRQ
jgi:MoaA/NifB/PqqE/SkfB family radical SAM enzyme